MMCAWMAIGRLWRQYVRLGLWGSNRQREESWYICLAAWSNLREGNMPLLKRWGLSSGGGDQTEASSKILDRPRCSLQPVSKRSISFKSQIFREVLKKDLSAWHIIDSLAYLVERKYPWLGVWITIGHLPQTIEKQFSENLLIFQNFNLAIFRSSPPLRQDIGPVLPWPIPSPRYKVRARGGLWICGPALFGNGDHIREERRCRQPLEPLCEVNTGDLSNMHHHHFKHLIFIIIINNNNTSFSSSSSLLSLQRQGRYHLHRQQHFKNKGICILDAETFYNLYNKTS